MTTTSGNTQTGSIQTVDGARAELHAALAKAQGEFPAITKDKTAKAGSYSYDYADLATILNAVRPVLSANGLAIVQPLENNGTPAIRTMLLHKDGAVLAASFPIPELPASPQALGSLLTYLRRYALVSMLGLAAEEDDDGNRAASHTQRPASGSSGTDTAPQQGPDATSSGFVAPNVEDVTAHQRGMIFAIRTKLLDAGVLTDETWREGLSQHYETEHVSELTRKQASDLIERLRKAEDELDAKGSA